MTAKEAVNWIINIMADIGKSEHRALWHYEQALMEIREMLETSAQPEPIKLYVDHTLTEEEIKNLKHKIADSPIVLMPSAQPEKRTDKRTETHGACLDTISRADVEQTVEDNIWCYTHSDRTIDQDPDTECHMAIRTALRMLRKDLRKLPSAQTEQRWIPCSERLPEVGTYVLISKKTLSFRSNLPSVCTAHRSCDPRSGKEEWIDMLFGKLDDDDVFAWMPLPEPYKAEGRTDV